MIRRTIVCAFAALAIAAPAANAAPLSPSTQFAFNTASNYWGGTGCERVDAQVVPTFGSPDIMGTYGQCSVYISRDLAGSAYFAKVCKMLVNVIGTWQGHAITANSPLPRTCLMHDLFLLNHPHYLERRFR